MKAVAAVDGDLHGVRVAVDGGGLARRRHAAAADSRRRHAARQLAEVGEALAVGVDRLDHVHEVVARDAVVDDLEQLILRHVFPVDRRIEQPSLISDPLSHYQLIVNSY